MSDASDGMAARPTTRAGFDRCAPYVVAPRRHGISLWLDGNEGVPLGGEAELVTARGDVARYPSTASLEARLAARFDVTPAQVVVTAGADEAIDRALRAYLDASRSLALHVPTFEMFDRYAALAGGRVATYAWRDGAFPLDAAIAVARGADVVALVSPNNPTGLSIPTHALLGVARAAPHALVLVDLAYVEHAAEDPSALLLGEPNVVVLRTFSKAFGIAGARVGYALGPAAVIGALRAAGGPYSVAAPSVALAHARLDAAERSGGLPYVDAIARERRRLFDGLEALSFAPTPSDANFVLARSEEPELVRDIVASRGIAIRTFRGRSGLGDALRIGVPWAPSDTDRLLEALALARPARISCGRGVSGGGATAEPVDHDASASEPTWFFTTEPGEATAARAAGCVVFGVADPGSARAAALEAAGVIRVVASPGEVSARVQSHGSRTVGA